MLWFGSTWTLLLISAPIIQVVFVDIGRCRTDTSQFGTVWSV